MAAADQSVHTFDEYLRRYRPAHYERHRVGDGDAVKRSAEESRQALREAAADLSNNTEHQ